jgi:energy-converting hydrogenase Eha subunit B
MASATGGTTTIVLMGVAGLNKTTVMAALAVWIGEREAANGGAGEDGIVT